MGKIKISFSGDDVEEAKEAFFDWWEDRKLENCFKNYCELAGWDIEVVKTEISGNTINIKV